MLSLGDDAWQSHANKIFETQRNRGSRGNLAIRQMKGSALGLNEWPIVTDFNSLRFLLVSKNFAFGIS